MFDLEYLLDDVFRFRPGNPSYVNIPEPVITSNNNETIIKVNVPGIKPENISVSAEDGMLTVQVSGNPGWLKRFSLSKSADVDGINATHELGVLQIHIPKRAALQKTIEIKRFTS